MERVSQSKGDEEDMLSSYLQAGATTCVMQLQEDKLIFTVDYGPWDRSVLFYVQFRIKLLKFKMVVLVVFFLMRLHVTIEHTRRYVWASMWSLPLASLMTVMVNQEIAAMHIGGNDNERLKRKATAIESLTTELGRSH